MILNCMSQLYVAMVMAMDMAMMAIDKPSRRAMGQ